MFLRIAKFNHAATLPHDKIILYSPFSHKQYSMAIHTELHKTAISSSSLYFSTLVINIVFSCLSLCRRHQHFLRPSTHSHLQHTISSLQSHCLIMFSCFSAFNLTLCPPCIISTRFFNADVSCNNKVKLKIHCKLHCQGEWENGLREKKCLIVVYICTILSIS